ncbi:MAG: hypothetical protein Q9170_003499 [Blastenia crenularia]
MMETVPRFGRRALCSRTAFPPNAFYQRRCASAVAAAHVHGPEEYHSLHNNPSPDVQHPPITPSASANARTNRLENVKPFSHFLTDTFQRQHTYLRISVTERCNLRCTYCMPADGVTLSPPAHLLSTPEIAYLSELFVKEGVTKIRLTGGEPTIREDILPLMHEIGNLRGKGLKELCLTTNGISLRRKLDAMVEAGLTGVNLSLDTLDPYQFHIMTRRPFFDAVMKSLNRILELNRLGAGIKLKLNAVVMRGVNEREIVPFVEMGKEHDIEVRFIEYMPFDGNKWSRQKMLSYKEMVEIIRQKYPDLSKVQEEGVNETSKTWQVPGFRGKIGFITSMTENFCGTCNRLRITSDGNLKVCLFGNSEVSLRDLLRKENDGEPIDWPAMEAMRKVGMDRRQGLSGSTGPLGYDERERELLEVIGMAVKRKKERHAGMGQLENMKNRPMILIGNQNSGVLPASIPRPPIGISEKSSSRWSPPQSRRTIPQSVLPFSRIFLPAYELSRPHISAAFFRSSASLLGKDKYERKKEERVAKRKLKAEQAALELPNWKNKVANRKRKQAEEAARPPPAPRFSFPASRSLPISTIDPATERDHQSRTHQEYTGNRHHEEDITRPSPLTPESQEDIGPSAPDSSSSSQSPSSASSNPSTPTEKPSSPPKSGRKVSIGPSQLPHLTSSSEVHQISITNKSPTPRAAIAIGTVRFSSPKPVALIQKHAVEKATTASRSKAARSISLS